MNKGLLMAVIIILIIAVGIAAFSAMSREKCAQCGENASNTTGNGTANKTEETSPNTVIIQDNSFNQKDITVKTGTNVQWINKDKKQHQIVSDEGTFKSPILDNGGVYGFYFAQTGVYGYHCSLHPTEIGKITVRN